MDALRERALLIENLRKYGTLAELRKSSFYAESHLELDRLFDTPEIILSPAASPRLGSFVRVAQWNIERGRRWSQVLDKLQSDDTLKWADLILLNEVDVGMHRSGNRHVGRELARALGMHMAFGPAHIELTRGDDDDDPSVQGENQESLQGNAVLTRYPISEAKIVRLPVCFEPYHFHEKRYGGRNCLWVKLQIAGRQCWVGSAHLEVRDTPACRARQLRYIISQLPGNSADGHLLGGDLNANSFARGTRWRTLVSLGHLTLFSPVGVKERLLHPERGAEPLFRVAKPAGFDWEELNSSDATACASIDLLEDANKIPAIILKLLQQRLEAYDHLLFFKLDWLLGRQVHGLRAGEIRDPVTGVASVSPGIVHCPQLGPDRISDHLPIYADITPL
jgi:endonuclease/exonuclease/phosphatase family metal-dependent hydrolase